MAALQVEGVEGEEHACREREREQRPRLAWAGGWRQPGAATAISDMASQPFTVALGNLYRGWSVTQRAAVRGMGAGLSVDQPAMGAWTTVYSRRRG